MRKSLINLMRFFHFTTLMIKPRILSTNEAPYLHNDHHEKVKNFKKPRA
jgi:hypothetical protein